MDLQLACTPVLPDEPAPSDLLAPAAPDPLPRAWGASVRIMAVVADPGPGPDASRLILVGVAPAGGMVALSRQGSAALGSTTADSAGIWSFELPAAQLPPGEHRLVAATVGPAAAADACAVCLDGVGRCRAVAA